MKFSHGNLAPKEASIFLMNLLFFRLTSHEEKTFIGVYME